MEKRTENGRREFIWAALLHMGTNTWCDQVLDEIPSSWGPYKGDEIKLVCSPERLKGFMMAPWFYTLPSWEKKNLEAIDQVGAEIKKG